jgi:hypothetical protein
MSRSIYFSVARRAVPAGLVVAAALADASGSAPLAFYAFLALVAVAAVIALNSYGELVDAVPDEGVNGSEPLSQEDHTLRKLQAVLWAVLLGFAVIGTASRAPALGEGAVPRVAATAVIACLLVLCVVGVVELVEQGRRRPISRARPASVTPIHPAVQSGSEEAASLARSING